MAHSLPGTYRDSFVASDAADIAYRPFQLLLRFCRGQLAEAQMLSCMRTKLMTFCHKPLQGSLQQQPHAVRELAQVCLPGTLWL
jgi:hypothetical protein